MKIAWVTPLAQSSAIGRASVAVCAALADRGHEVRIIRSEAGGHLNIPHHPTSLPVFSHKELNAIDICRNHDATFINVGDNYNFHAGIFPYLIAQEAIGIFHDFYLYNLFSGWIYHENENSPELHHRTITEVYGDASDDLAVRVRAGDVPLDRIAAEIPMTEWVAARCAGAIAHSGFYRFRLEAVCPGPIEVARLPWEKREVTDAPVRNGERLTLLTVGVVNPNKLVDLVLQAIGSSNFLKATLDYVVAGSVEEPERLRLETLSRDLEVSLTLLGSVTDETLTERLEAADIISCLRWPVLEGASASAIEGMLSGRPTLVVNAGFYADIPDHYVAKVSADPTAEEVRDQLERLARDEGMRLRMGSEAKAWATTAFSVSPYADALESVARDLIRFWPYARLGHQIARQLSELGLSSKDPSIQHFARVIEDMAGLPRRS